LFSFKSGSVIESICYNRIKTQTTLWQKNDHSNSNYAIQIAVPGMASTFLYYHGLLMMKAFWHCRLFYANEILVCCG